MRLLTKVTALQREQRTRMYPGGLAYVSKTCVVYSIVATNIRQLQEYIFPDFQKQTGGRDDEWGKQADGEGRGLRTNVFSSVQPFHAARAAFFLPTGLVAYLSGVQVFACGVLHVPQKEGGGVSRGGWSFRLTPALSPCLYADRC